MAEPLVSVVIPVYNVEAYLDRCVASVVGQTYSNLEIILVDDGSPDGCPDICDGWAKMDDRIRVIHQENRGIGLARNSGLDAASGEYICFFDSDDYVDTAIVEKCVTCAETHHADAVAFGRWDAPEGAIPAQRPVIAPKSLYREDEILSELLPGMLTYRFGFGISVWGKLYRLATIRSNGIRFPSEREIISEDAWFAMAFFSKAKTVGILPECLYYYVQRNGSFSRGYDLHRQKKNDVFLAKCLDYICQNDLPEVVAVHLKARYHIYILGAMKQIMASELSEKQKRQTIWEIFASPALRGTLSRDVLAAEGKNTIRIFFRLLKYRCYGVCYLLLRFKNR